MTAVVPRCIMRPRLDGGTRFALDLPTGWRDGVRPEIAPVFELAGRIARGELRRSAGRAPRQALLRTWWGKHVAADVSVGGERHQVIRLHIADCVRIELDTEWSPRRGYAARCVVQFAARLLHTEASQVMVVLDWLRTVQLWVIGKDDRVSDWRPTNVEMCADFVGVPWTRNDQRGMVIPRGQIDTGEIVSRVVGRATSERATVTFGRRGASPVSICLYNKTSQILACKGGDISTYAAQWRAHGWNGTDNVTRAELRFTPRGLQWAAVDARNNPTGEVVTMMAPELASSPRRIAQIWANTTQRMKLTIPGSASQRKRWKVDPRWEVVRAAAQTAPVRVMQLREVQRDTHDVAVRMAVKQAATAVMRWGSLHGVAARSAETMQDMFATMMHALEPDQRHELLEVLPDAAYRRRAALLGDEVEAAAEKMQVDHPELYASLRRLGWSTIADDDVSEAG